MLNSNMKSLTLLQVLLIWLLSGYQVMAGLSSLCKRCVEHPCPLNIGLLSELSLVDLAAIREAAAIISTEKDFSTKWTMNM